MIIIARDITCTMKNMQFKFITYCSLHISLSSKFCPKAQHWISLSLLLLHQKQLQLLPTTITVVEIRKFHWSRPSNLKDSLPSLILLQLSTYIKSLVIFTQRFSKSMSIFLLYKSTGIPLKNTAGVFYNSRKLIHVVCNYLYPHLVI